MNFDFDFPAFSVVQFWKRNGIEVEDLTPQLGEFLGVHNGEGVLVRSVEEASPAEVAGLKAGDVVVKVNGEAVSSGADWRHAMRNQKGPTVSFVIIRERHEQTVSMKLPEQKDLGGGADLSPETQERLESLHRLGPGFEHASQEQEQAARELERSMRDMQRELEQGKQEQEREMRELRRQIERMAHEGDRSTALTEKQKHDMQALKRDLARAQQESERAQREAEKELQEAQNEAQQVQQAEQEPEQKADQKEEPPAPLPEPVSPPPAP
jgi:myosin heavy subunit